MSISAVNSSLAAAAFQSAAPAQRPQQPPSLDNTAKLLGTTADDLRGQLQSGKTLDDLASAKGVSSSDLINAVKSDLQANKPAGAPDLSDDQLTRMATDVAAGKGPGRAHGHHHHHAAAAAGAADDTQTADAKLQGLADSLGVNQSDLADALAQAVQTGTGPFSETGAYGASGTFGAGQTDGGLVVDEYA